MYVCIWKWSQRVHCPLFSVNEWPRLLSSLERPHWLRIDFDHWEDLSDREEESEGEREEERDRALARERVAEMKEKQVI